MHDKRTVHRTVRLREDVSVAARVTAYNSLIGLGPAGRLLVEACAQPIDVDAPIPYVITELGRADLARWRAE
jgi:hypothetical protein